MAMKNKLVSRAGDEKQVKHKWWAELAMNTTNMVIRTGDGKQTKKGEQNWRMRKRRNGKQDWRLNKQLVSIAGG